MAVEDEGVECLVEQPVSFSTGDGRPVQEVPLPLKIDIHEAPKGQALNDQRWLSSKPAKIVGLSLFDNAVLPPPGKEPAKIVWMFPYLPGRVK